MSATPNLNLTHLTSNSDQPEVPVNAAFDGLDNAQNAVGSVDVSAGGIIAISDAALRGAALLRLTGSPSSDFTVTVGSTIARFFTIYNSTAKTAALERDASPTTESLTIPPGSAVIVHNDGSNLRALSQRSYTIGTYYDGVAAASDVVMKFVLVDRTLLKTALPGSRAHAGVAATAATSFTIKKNGASIGTMDFALGAQIATFSFASDITFEPGDRLEITAPASPDSTLADIALSLRAIYEN